MTDLAQDRQGMRSRGPSLPKLNFMPASHFLQQQNPHYTQTQHPFDIAESQPVDAGNDIELDMDMAFDTTPMSEDKNDSATQRSYVSAHPSPDTSDESDCERSANADETSTPATQVPFSSSMPVPSSSSKLGQSRRRQSQIEPSLTHHLFLAPVPIPSSSRTPPHSPLNYRQRLSISMNTPPNSASSVAPAPCSDSAAVDAQIREHVHANMLSHSTDKAFFWHLGKLGEFSFSDRFVRSRVFEIKDNSTVSAVTASDSTSITSAVASSPGTGQQGACSWRLRLYPHGRGDRHRDSEFVGLYLQQEAVRVPANRRGSVIASPPVSNNFSSSAPTPFLARGSISSNPRRSISGASTLPPVRRHVTLFIATEKGDCLAKQDLVEWFSGSEGGLGFPRIVSRKTVQDAVKTVSMIDDDEEEGELGIVAGVIFHEL